jgi:hypothetical protein
MWGLPSNSTSNHDGKDIEAPRRTKAAVLIMSARERPHSWHTAQAQRPGTERGAVTISRGISIPTNIPIENNATNVRISSIHKYQARGRMALDPIDTTPAVLDEVEDSDCITSAKAREGYRAEAAHSEVDGRRERRRGEKWTGGKQVDR